MGLRVSGAATPNRVSLAKPPSYPTRVPSKFRTGPAMVMGSLAQEPAPPPGQSPSTWHGAPGFVAGGLQTPGVGVPGNSGNFMKSGPGFGMGEVRVGTEMLPVNPVSPPPSKGEPPFGSLNGPNVLWNGEALVGSIPSPDKKACPAPRWKMVPEGQPPPERR